MTTAIARRYARACFDLARAQDKVVPWRRDLALAAETLTHPEVARALRNPRLSVASRTGLALELLDGLGEQPRNLVRLLVERGRTAIIGSILAEYGRLADAAAGVVRADVVTAVTIDGDLHSRIAAALSQRFGGQVEVTLRTDPEIGGGLVIRVGDRVIDRSIRTHLQQLRAELTHR